MQNISKKLKKAVIVSITALLVFSSASQYAMKKMDEMEKMDKMAKYVVAVGGSDGLKLWSLEKKLESKVKDGIKTWGLEKKLIRSIGDAYIKAVAFSPDGRRIAYIEGDTIYLCDLEGKVLKTFKQPKKMERSPDGRYGLLVCSPVSREKVLETFKQPRDVVWSPDGKYFCEFIKFDPQLTFITLGGEDYLVSGMSDFVQVWDIKQGRSSAPIYTFEHDELASVAAKGNAIVTRGK